MPKFGEYFKYNGKTTMDWDLILCNFDNDDEVPMSLSRDIDKGDTNKYKLVSNHFGTSYNDVLSFDIHVMKNPCNFVSQEESKFTRKEIREINAWLTSPSLPLYLQIADLDSNEDETIEYCGLFTDVKTFVAGGDIYGLIFTFTCNSSFGFSEEKSFTYACTNDANGTSFNLYNDSDEINDYIYPVITIEPKETMVITLLNQTDNNGCMSLSVQKNNTLTVDCNNLKITDLAGIVNLCDIIADDIGEMYWFRLSHGKNIINVHGSCLITCKYREYRKVGAY